MRHLSSACAAALLVAAPASLHGQSAGAAPGITLRAAAGGVIPMGGALDAYDPGWTVAGALRLGEHRPVALQLEALYARVAGDAFTVPGPADAPVRVEPRTSFTALTATGVLTPWRATAVRPYLVAGGGWYRYASRNGADGLGDLIAPGPDGNGFGVTYGGGLETTLGRVAPFVEVRQHIVFRDEDNMSFVPVTIGVRF